MEQYPWREKWISHRRDTEDCLFIKVWLVNTMTFFSSLPSASSGLVYKRNLYFLLQKNSSCQTIPKINSVQIWHAESSLQDTPSNSFGIHFEQINLTCTAPAMMTSQITQHSEHTSWVKILYLRVSQGSTEMFLNVGFQNRIKMLELPVGNQSNDEHLSNMK